MVALDYFRRLGHDNHRRFSKLYTWEEKKSKTSWGETEDYEKIAAAAVEGMKAAGLNRFLVVCDRHRRKGGVVEGQSERRWPTGREAHNIEIVPSQAVVAKR